jgi:PhnB protein
MANKVKFIPDGYHTVTPYLIVSRVSSLIDFLKQVFDAEERERIQMPDGRIMHAEVRIGDSVVMMGEAADSQAAMPAMLHIYLEDADAAYRRALAAGATSLREPEDQFYGDRTAGVQDAFGNQWWLATHIEDVSAEEMQRRAKAQAPQPG